MRELLVDTCQETGEDGRVHGYRYYILVGEMAVKDGLACESYGVKVAGADGQETSIPNITIRAERIDELIELLIRNAVSPLSLPDVVADWL